MAAVKAVRGKKSKRDIKRFLEHRNENLENLRHLLASGQFKTSTYKIIKVSDPKERLIYVLPLYPDHILHHALMNILAPIWQSLFIRDSYACIPGRGLTAASKRLMSFMRRNEFVLQCDIRKFFPSISHRKMMDIIRRKISDPKILDLLGEIVYSVKGGKNMPIGNLTSQWMGNLYLNELDMFVKHKLHWHDYIRYCDDFCLFGNDARQLRSLISTIGEFLDRELDLTFSKAVVRPTALGVDYIGYRHFKKFILLRRRTAKRIRKRLVNIVRFNDTSSRATGQLASAHGWCKWACTYNYRRSVYREAQKARQTESGKKLKD